LKLPAQRNNEDYETILSNLANDIQKRQLKLSEIRLRERRSTFLTTLYTFGAWVAYVSVWYWDSLPTMRKWANPVVAKGVTTIPVIFGPVVYVYPNLLSSFA
jgi:endoplasmic reticulum junction formation protein lunapark